MFVKVDKNIRALTALISIIFVLGFFVLSLFNFAVSAEILDAQVSILNLESTRPQVIFYLSLLGLFATVCAVLLLCPNVKIIPKMGQIDHLILTALIVVAVIFGSWPKMFLAGFLIVLLICLLSSAPWVEKIAGTSIGSKLMQVKFFSGRFYWLLTGGILIYMFLFSILPLAKPLPIWNEAHFQWVDGHYAATVLPGFDLLFHGFMERANYGLAMPMLTAFSLKLFSLFGFSNTALEQVVKLHQLLALVMIGMLSFLTNKKYFPHVMALALGMTAFTLSNTSHIVGYPNQSGIRYIPILASLIILVVEMRREQVRVWLLASTAAFFVIMSPETGLAATAGYIVAVILNRYDRERPAGSLFETIFRFGLFFLVTGIVGSVLIVEPILKNTTGGIFQFLTVFIKDDYGGMVDKPSLMATILFFAATTVVLRGVLHSRNGAISKTEAYEAALGTVILVWLIYYANRMAELNLWFQSVLLILLIAPRIDYREWKILVRRPLRCRLTLAMVIACAIGGQLAYSSSHFAGNSIQWFQRQYVGCTECIILDGKSVPWLPKSRIQLQINALTEKHSPPDTLVLSGISCYARRHGFNSDFPWYSPGEIIYKKDVEKLVNWIEKRGPKYIIADDPNDAIAMARPEHSKLIQSYLHRLTSYSEVRRDSGWIVLERVTKSASSL